MKWIILFAKCYKLGMGEKTLKRNALPSPFYDMEADCFPVSENVENKPDLP